MIYGVNPTGIEFKDCPEELFDNSSKPENYSGELRPMHEKK